MRIADTSALYGAFVPADTHHASAQQLLADAEPIFVPTEIFAETVALLQLRFGFDAAHQAGSFLRGLPHVRIDGATVGVAEAAWREFARGKGRLSLPDAFVVAWCLHESAKPLTFDREILKAVGA